ncbi:AI-2E family transporter [soil metagenome]
MTEKRFTESLLFKALCGAMFVGIVIFFLIFFKELLKPLAFGILLWYFIKAFNGLIEKIKFRGKPLRPWIRRTIALLIIVGVFEGSIRMLVSNVNQIIVNYSTYLATLNSMIANLGEMINMPTISQDIDSKVSELNIEAFLKDFVTSTSSIVGNLFLVLVYTIFIILEEQSFIKKISLVFNAPGQAERMSSLFTQIYHSLNKYMLVKTYVSVAVAILGYIVMVIVGVEFAFLWALLIFTLNFIPYVGPLISTLLPAAFSILQFGTIWPFLWIFGAIEAIHLIFGNYVEPKVMGKSLNLSPLVVLVALAFWGSVWGLLGMLLSVPFTSIMLITFAQFPSTRGLAIMLTENGDIEQLAIKDDSIKLEDLVHPENLKS